MRIKHLFVSNYKNLKKFSLDFDGNSFIDVFVGKNGSGKSNMFEALIEIFRHLYENDYVVEFDYKLYYVKGANDIKIEWKWEIDKWFDEAGKETKKVTQDKLPDNILIYYSGHNPKVKELVNQYEKKFSDGLLGAKEGNSRQFIGIGNDYKSLLLSILLLQPNQNKAKKYILEKLDVQALSLEFKIVLQRPEFAKKTGYDIDPFDPSTRFWKTGGITKKFLDKIYEVKKGDANGKVRDEGYFKNEGYNDRYVLYYDIVDFQKRFEDESPQAIFRSFDNLKTLNMLADISIEITLKDGSTIDVQQFSDGQFQSVYIYSIIELFKDRTCITLLDEPDSFLHPEWQYNFLTQISDIASESSVCNHVLMTSHSAVTLIPHAKDKIRFFDFKSDGSINTYYLQKRIAINKLSSNIISYCEQDQILSIINTIQIENKPVFFTEGKTDPLIIKEAWNKLHPEEEIPFIPFYAFGHKYLAQLMKDPEVIKDMKELPIFGLFDYDKAYNSWNAFSKDEICTDTYKGQIKKLNDHEVYAIMLPVPKDKSIKNQVINPETGRTYGENSLMAIEHLFCHIPEFESLFEIDQELPSKFIKFSGDKVKFAKIEVPKIAAEHFEVFRPMFEFITSKI